MNSEFIINPFVSVGSLKFGSDREFINTALNIELKAVFEKTLDGAEFVTDHYHDEGLMLGYLTENFKLKYVILTDPCEAIFEGGDLLAMNYGECLDFMNSLFYYFNQNSKQFLICNVKISASDEKPAEIFCVSLFARTALLY